MELCVRLGVRSCNHRNFQAVNGSQLSGANREVVWGFCSETVVSGTHASFAVDMSSF